MKHLCTVFLLAALTGPALAQTDSAPIDGLAFYTSDWINTDKVDDYLQSSVTIKKVSNDLSQVHYHSDGRFSDNAAAFDGSAFNFFNFCVGDYLTARTGNRYWTLGTDHNQAKTQRTKAGPDLDIYFAVAQTEKITPRHPSRYKIDWLGESFQAGAFNKLCKNYLKPQYVVPQPAERQEKE